MKKITMAVMTLCVLVMPIQPRGSKNNGVEFTKSSQALGDTRTFGIAIGDVDMDGDNDVFMSNYIAPSRLWLNKGDGTFALSDQDFDIGEVHDAAMADLNGDT
ncbi:MAG: VCBS repeat-containing protein [Candidatus Aminicenantes bacterium]|nr:VCBS repeat-containing protein [Candidatus Aminicenantes bacterium]